MDWLVVYNKIQRVRYRSEVIQVQDICPRVSGIQFQVINKIHLEQAQPQRGTQVP